MGVQHLESKDFHHIIEQGQHGILVDFWAPWCMPCRSLSPILESLAEELDNLTIYKINVEEAPDLVEEYQILSVPTMLYFEEGILKQRLTGALPKNQIKKELGL